MELFSDNGGVDGAATGPLPSTSVSLLDGVSVGIYSVDDAGRCTQMNASAAHMLGYTEAECLGRNMHDLIHYKRPDGSPYPIEECPLVQTKERRLATYDLHETIWRKDGRPVHVSCSAVPVVNERGSSVTVITLNDIRPQREAEDRLQYSEHQQRDAMRQRDAAARIERDLATENAARQRETSLAVERAAADQLRQQQQLVEEQLMQSERLASVGRLAASISHEINNPLEAVTNLLYLVRMDASLSSQSLEYLRMADEELARVTEIVAQTLRFQRGSVAPVDCMPEKLVGSVIALHQGRLHNTGIKIDVQHRQSKTIRCAEGDVRQVINNLISNAIDAMRTSGGTITVRTRPANHLQTGQQGLRVTVADMGHGMSAATAAKIFEPFYTTKGEAGSGLGLWISSSIARRHGGRLSVRSSTVGTRRGTTFSLFLPELAAESDPAGTVQ
jgi:PAS domain S-box-containing protein